jgi:hypothetical protein
MKRLLIAFAFGLGAACLLAPGVANAQATRTWVSGVGDDANPCSRTAPCKTFAGAISKTAAAGEINCLDDGGYGALTITKSIAIKCDGHEAGVLVSGTNGFVVSAASTDVVWISGLDFEGLGPTALSLNGIKLITASHVTVSNCTIRGFGSTNGTDGNGIFVANTSNMRVDSDYNIIGDNALVGIEVKPASGATANVHVNNTRAFNNATGFRGNGTGGGGNINIDVLDSVATNGVTGVNVTSGGQTVQMEVNHSTLSFNSNLGAAASNANATIRIGYSTITGNGNSASGTGGGMVLSYGNNQIDGNTVNTTPTTTPLH